MIVQKFGGTSVGSADRIKHVAELVNREEERIVVLSAFSGTTNELSQIVQHLYRNEKAAIVLGKQSTCLIQNEEI